MMAKALMMMVVAVAGLQYISAVQGAGPCFTDPKSADCANPSTFYPDDAVNMVSATHDVSFRYVQLQLGTLHCQRHVQDNCVHVHVHMQAHACFQLFLFARRCMCCA